MDENRVPKIMTQIYETDDGEYFTKTFFDGVVVKDEPTPQSQIRPKRKSCLWVIGVPEDKTFKRITCKQ